MAGETFAQRHLDPGDRIAEILCGLVMVLTFTLTAGLEVGSGKGAERILLLAAIGCNVAWGIIDGVLYVLDNISERSQKARLAKAVQAAPDDSAALELLRGHLGAGLLSVAPTDDRAAQDRLFLSLRRYLEVATVPSMRVRRDDLLGAVAIFWLELVCCLPGAVPFLFIKDPVWALDVSNAILITLLFVAGFIWARYTETPRLRAGFVMAGLGLALVGVATLLGG
jgi:VIT1/CCC1 family predicted Fe2+/Mn2+ transporter